MIQKEVKAFPADHHRRDLDSIDHDEIPIAILSWHSALDCRVLVAK